MKSAIIFSVFAICLVGIYSQEPEEPSIAEIKRKCIETTGVDENLLQQQEDTLTYVKNDKVDCYFACAMQARGIMDSDGNVNEEHKMFSSYSFNAQDCAKLRGSSVCETGGKIAECIITSASKQIVDFYV